MRPRDTPARRGADDLFVNGRQRRGRGPQPSFQPRYHCCLARCPALPKWSAMTVTLTHLQRLEAEAIHIMREVVAEATKVSMELLEDDSLGLDLADLFRDDPSDFDF